MRFDRQIGNSLIKFALFFVCAASSSLTVNNQKASATTDSASPLPGIVQIDFKTLRTPAQPVPIDQIQSPEVQSFIKKMVDVMRDAPGVGLAAPQIGDPRQIIVLFRGSAILH